MSDEKLTDVQWMIGGEAGYGIMTTGLMMSKIFTRLGLSVFDYVEYPSLIRGGHNAYYVHASEEEILAQKKPIDILVALNRETIDIHKHELSTHAAVLYDPLTTQVQDKEFGEGVLTISVPFIQITRDLSIDKLMMNTVSAGASLALFTSDFSVLEQILTESFSAKGEGVVAKNVNAARKGFEYVIENGAHLFEKKFTAKESKSIVLSGAEAVALGAIRSGLKFAAMYPMTPINSLMTTLVSYALKFNIVVKEPEDEISGIMMGIGASYAGVRSMVATSGGGFCLMSEGLGLAAQAEIPLVIVEGMRPGPATGMPTWTEQGDLRFVLHAHQGDFPRVVCAPGDIFECFELTTQAFTIADKYQLPVIILVDKYIMEGHGSVLQEKIEEINRSYVIDRGAMVSNSDGEENDYKRYALEENGISVRSIPGQKGKIALTGSDEHDEKGLYNEDPHMRIAMMHKRFKKMGDGHVFHQSITIKGNEDSLLTIFFFGSTKMPLFDAAKDLEKQGVSLRLVQIISLAPFPADEVLHIIETSKKTMIIEGNYSGQLEGIIREYTGKTIGYRFRKYDGRPFYPEELVEEIKKIL